MMPETLSVAQEALTPACSAQGGQGWEGLDEQTLPHPRLDQCRRQEPHASRSAPALIGLLLESQEPSWRLHTRNPETSIYELCDLGSVTSGDLSLASSPCKMGRILTHKVAL